MKILISKNKIKLNHKGVLVAFLCIFALFLTGTYYLTTYMLNKEVNKSYDDLIELSHNFSTSIFEIENRIKSEAVNAITLDLRKVNLESPAFNMNSFYLKSFLGHYLHLIDSIIIVENSRQSHQFKLKSGYYLEYNSLKSDEVNRLINDTKKSDYQIVKVDSNNESKSIFLVLNINNYFKVELKKLSSLHFASSFIGTLSGDGVVSIAGSCFKHVISMANATDNLKNKLAYSGEFEYECEQVKQNMLLQTYPINFFNKDYVLGTLVSKSDLTSSVIELMIKISFLSGVSLLFAFVVLILFSSQEKKIREELRVVDAQLAQSSRLSLLGEMASGIAHEINNPLAVIIANSQMLRRQVKSIENEAKASSINNHIDRIEKTGNRIAKIINNLRLFARDGSSDPFDIVRLDKVISDTLELSQERMYKKEVQFDLFINPPEIELIGSEVQLGQVLLNLISNAIDAIENLDEKWIRISAELSNNELMIKIINSGPKIPPQIADKILQPFFTTKPTGKGTGLGLSISLGIIDKHGGQLYLDQSCINTCFVIKLKGQVPLQKVA